MHRGDYSKALGITTLPRAFFVTLKRSDDFLDHVFADGRLSLHLKCDTRSLDIRVRVLARSSSFAAKLSCD